MKNLITAKKANELYIESIKIHNKKLISNLHSWIETASLDGHTRITVCSKTYKSCADVLSSLGYCVSYSNQNEQTVMIIDWRFE